MQCIICKQYGYSKKRLSNQKLIISFFSRTKVCSVVRNAC